MTYNNLLYGTVREHPRKVIHVVRVVDELLQPHELDEIAARMRERALRQGEQAATVVVVQGGPKETLRLFGEPYSVTRVRDALFNAAIGWQPIELG
jgi:hypothetical protein